MLFVNGKLNALRKIEKRNFKSRSIDEMGEILGIERLH